MTAISVVIPSRNEGGKLLRTVRSLVEGRSGAFPLEVVVVDDASTDGSCDRLAEAIGPTPGVRLVVRRLERWSGVPYARNRGAESAGSPVLLITDANTSYPRNWDCLIRQHIAPGRLLTGTIVDAATGARGYGLTLSLPSMGVDWLTAPHTFGGYVPVAAGACTVLGRVQFHHLGGYDETLPLYGAAEPEFSVRAWLAGYEIVNVPDLTVGHHFRPPSDLSHFYQVNQQVLLRNYVRFACSYLPEDMLTSVFDFYAQALGGDFLPCLADLRSQGIWDRRAELEKGLPHDFAWFARQFGLAVRPPPAEPWLPAVPRADLARTLAVIPAYGQHHLTAQVVADCAREPVGIVVVDNRGDYQATGTETVLRPGTNTGWLHGNNLAIERELPHRRWDRFVLLNNDLRLSTGFFAGLVWTELSSGASVVGASYDGWWKVQRPDEVANGTFLPAGSFIPRPVYLPYGACDGTCVSVHRRVFDRVGLLDGQAFGRFGWAASTDLCFRARDAGMTTAISRAAFANHLDGGRHTARAVFGAEYETLAEAEGSHGMVAKWGFGWRDARPVPTTVPCVVYTAITGERDTLKDPLFVPPGWRFVCFTDSPHVRSSVWDVRPLAWSSPDGDPRRTARWHKVNAHTLFPDDRVSIWADASVRATNDWRRLLWYLGSFGLASYLHPARDCLYDEAHECARLGLDDPGCIREQVARYRAAGYPAHYGLLETTILVRRHGDPDLVRFADLWWDEISKGSKRDQLSVNYVGWRLGLRFGVVRDTLRSSAWLERDSRQQRGRLGQGDGDRGEETLRGAARAEVAAGHDDGAGDRLEAVRVRPAGQLGAIRVQVEADRRPDPRG
jgi:GT2 family glycosyltransferase